MSDKPHQPVNIVTPEEYGRNLAQIQAAKVYITEMERANEAGRETYESELLRKVREGEEALHRLKDLGRLRSSGFNGPLAIEPGPSSSRIEEVSTSPQNMQWAAAQVPVQPSLQTSYYRPTASTSTQPTPTARTPYNSYPYGAVQYPAEQLNQSYMGQTLNGGYSQQAQRFPPYTFQPQHSTSTYAPLPSVSQSGQTQPARHLPVANSTTPTSYQSRVDSKSRSTRNVATSSQPRWIPSGNQTSELAHAQTPSTQGVALVSRPQSNGETVQNLQGTMHYAPTGAQQSASSSLTNALGQPLSQTPYQLNASSSPSVNTIDTTNLPRRTGPHPQTAVAGLSTDQPQAPVSPVNHRDLIKDHILKFREAILEWGNLALPGASRKYKEIHAYKDSNQTLRIISTVDGRRLDEDFETFFKRLWTKAGLLPEILPQKPVPMVQQSSLSQTTLSPAPAPAGAASAKPTSAVASRPSVPVQNTAVSFTHSSSLASASKPVSHPPLNTSSTPSRHRTLVGGGGIWRSPADADMKKLARDVMFALGKRKHGPTSPSGAIENASKRQALESSASATSEQVRAVPAPVLQPSTGVPSTTTSSAGLSQRPNNQQSNTPLTSTQSMPNDVTRSIPSPAVTVLTQVQELDQSSASTRPSHAGAIPASETTAAILTVPQEVEVPGQSTGQTISTVPPASTKLSHAGAVPSSETTAAILTAPQEVEVPGQSIGQTISTVPPASSSIATGGVTPQHDLSQLQASVAVQPSASSSLPRLHVDSSSTAIRGPRPVQFINTYPSNADANVSSGSYVRQVTFLPSWSQVQASLAPSGQLSSYSNNQSTLSTSTKDPQPPVPAAPEISTSNVTVHDVDISMDANAPPSGTTNLWPTGFDMVSPEVVPSSQKLAEPLFLPSPSSSPGPLTASSVAYVDKGKGRAIYPPSSLAKPHWKGRNKRSSVYVLIPPPPEYLVRHRKQEAKKVERLSRNGSTRNSSVVSWSVANSTSSEDLSFAFETERDSTIDPLATEAVKLACSRLQALPCRWDRCDTVLNSRYSLLHHLNQEHKPIPRQGGNTRQSFICRWTQCGRQCSIRENHFERHALVPFQCAFKGCKETHRSSRQLLKHFETAHVDGVMRQQATPFYPKDLALVPVPDVILPSYLIVAPLAQPFPISKDRHAAVGSWVWYNISRSDEEEAQNNPMLAEASNDYVFLNKRTTRYSWIQSQPVDVDFADLESEEISRQCDLGLTFFAEDGESIAGASEETPERTERSLSPLFPTPKNEDADTNCTEEHNHFVRLPVLQLPTNNDDDEESVQRLLWGDEE